MDWLKLNIHTIGSRLSGLDTKGPCPGPKNVGSVPRCGVMGAYRWGVSYQHETYTQFTRILISDLTKVTSWFILSIPSLGYQIAFDLIT